MAYSTSNPPVLAVMGGINGSNGNVWIYKDGDAAGDIDAAGYITNGRDLGMKLDDVVIVIDTATPLVTTHRVESVGTGTTRSVNLALGTTIGSATSGD